MIRHPIRLLVALAALLSLASAANSQGTEFRMDETGQWVAVPVGDASAPGSDLAVINQARRDIAEERFGDAKSALADWIKQNERTKNPLLARAYLLRGDALTALGDEFEALYDYEAVCLNFPDSEEYVRAVERELDIAVRYANGYDRKFLGIRWLDASDAGEELLIRVQERLPGSRLAERAGIELGDFYYRQRDMPMAAEAYRLFLQNYPKSQYVQKAMQRQVYATIARFKGPRYDGTALVDAAVLIRTYMNRYPAAAQNAGLDETLLARIDESGGAEMLETAKWYLSVGDSVSARYTVARLIDKHPRTAAASAALRMQVEHKWVELAKDQPASQPSQATAPSTLEPKTAPVPMSAPPQKPAPTQAAPAKPAPFTPGRPLKPRDASGSNGGNGQ